MLSYTNLFSRDSWQEFVKIYKMLIKTGLKGWVWHVSPHLI